MKLFLDTHALLWWLADSERLGARARALISDPGHDALVSAVSFWEIVVKVRAGKLEADIDEVLLCVDRQGFVPLARLMTEDECILRYGPRYGIQTVACSF